ncbi:MAG TPA: hypothetical protein VFU85_06765 [Nocardioides sp.]|nr:hypothetical protein [Nocardioides sp.]
MLLGYDVELFFGDTNPDAAVLRLRPIEMSGPLWSRLQAETIATGFPQAWRERTGIGVRVVEVWHIPTGCTCTHERRHHFAAPSGAVPCRHHGCGCADYTPRGGAA